MENIKWEEYKGTFPKPGYYLVKFSYKGNPSEEDYSFYSAWKKDYGDIDHSTARGRCCVTKEEVIITGYVFLCDLDF